MPLLISASKKVQGLPYLDANGEFLPDLTTQRLHRKLAYFNMPAWQGPPSNDSNGEWPKSGAKLTFLSVLAYHFVHMLRLQLKAQGIDDSWQTLRETLAKRFCRNRRVLVRSADEV